MHIALTKVLDDLLNANFTIKKEGTIFEKNSLELTDYPFIFFSLVKLFFYVFSFTESFESETNFSLIKFALFFFSNVCFTFN